MSFLTKLFVVLLVLSAMLLSATTVVFVQKTDDSRQRAAESELARRQEVIARQNAEHQLAALEQARKTELAVLLADKKAAEAKSNDLNSQIAKLNTDLASLTDQTQTQTAQVTKLTEALASAQHLSDGQSTELAADRQNLDALTRKAHELNDALTDDSARREAAERQLTFAQEQIKDQTDKIAQLQQQVPAAASNAPIAPSTDVSGLISDAMIIGGVPYATISVGSADNVGPKMQLNVVKDGTFIGLITITTVEPHQAVGRLQGPNVGTTPSALAALKGAEVKSQL